MTKASGLILFLLSAFALLSINTTVALNRAFRARPPDRRL